MLTVITASLLRTVTMSGNIHVDGSGLYFTVDSSNIYIIYVYIYMYAYLPTRNMRVKVQNQLCIPMYALVNKPKKVRSYTQLVKYRKRIIDDNT